MIKELFLQPNKELAFVEAKDKLAKMRRSRATDQPELSLGPSVSAFSETSNGSSSTESDANLCRKRKHTWNESSINKTQGGSSSSIDLQLNDPVPMDWEQCLDLQTGRMYYINRKTFEKSWARPKERNIDLDLNISTLASSEGKVTSSTSSDQYPYSMYSNSSSTGSMVAVACLNCHLLVMLSKSSPSCPNCKYVHSLLPSQPRKIEAAKSLETLSLLH